MLMLRRNPELKVYALHDASPAGIEMPRRLLEDDLWFKSFANVQVFDLGLMPRQVMNRRVYLSDQNKTTALTAASRTSLQPVEATWLDAGHIVEIESIRPQKLLQMAALGIAKSRDPRAADAYVSVDGSGSGGDLYVYSSDSFG